jgi:hypothetical protein
MCGGLSKWLRAYGYDTFWEYGIDDAKLVDLAQTNAWFILTSDSLLMLRRPIASAQVNALHIPVGLSRKAQLKYVVDKLHLKRKATRCMACGGFLVEVDKEAVKEQIPPKTYNWLDYYQQCRRCKKLYWQGTHWQRIQDYLDQLE